MPRNLNEVLSWEEERVVQGDWTVACEGKRYQLDRQHEALSLVRRKVIVRTLRNGRVQLVYRGKPLKWRLRPEGAVRKPQPVRKPKPMKTKAAPAPPASHPWRRDGVGAGKTFWSGIKAEGRRVRAAPAGGAGLRSAFATLRPPCVPHPQPGKPNNETNNKGDISKEFRQRYLAALTFRTIKCAARRLQNALDRGGASTAGQARTVINPQSLLIVIRRARRLAKVK